MKKHILILPVLFLMFAYACKKDKPIIEDSDVDYSAVYDNDYQCGSFPPDDGTPFNLEKELPSFMKPVFKGGSNDKFVYIRNFGDICTSTINDPSNSQVIKNLTMGFPLSYTKDGWLFLYSFYKIKDNGDSFGQLSTQGIGDIVHGDLSPDSKRIVFMDGYFNFSFRNLDGSGLKKLDTFRGSEFVKWAKDGKKIAMAMENDIVITDTFGHAVSFKNVLEHKFCYGIDWFPGNRWIIFGTTSGVYKMDIKTSKKVKLRTNCDLRTYLFPSISTDGKRILFARVDISFPNKYIRHVNQSIYIMDSDGKNEHRLDLE